MQTITITEQDILKSFNGIPKKLTNISQEEKRILMYHFDQNIGTHMSYFPQYYL